MTRRLVRSALAAVCLASAPVLPALPGVAGAEPAGLEARAKDFLALLAKEDFAGATRDFDDTMKKALLADKLEATWKGLIEKFGAFQKAGGARVVKAGQYEVVLVPCTFAKGTVDARVSFDGDKQIAGLFFTERKPAVPYTPPSYVRPDAFKESQIRVGSGEWELPGTLALPVGDGPFPAVVLVHGSGPNDRDETVGGQKPFRDLAGGLASRGIAVLRYEKRTRQYGAKVVASKEPFTVKEEVVDDAVAAVELLHKHPGVDGKRIVVLGHSLGGGLAPQIAAGDRNVAGLILLAGFTRPLEDMMVEQTTYVLSLDDSLPEKEKEARLDKLKEAVARIKDPKLARDAPAADLLGGGGAYWLSLRDYHPAEAAAKLRLPMLILQGERDYQVTMTDFANWKKALSGHNEVTFTSYPKLNHLFAEGEGKGKPEEYDKPSHVGPEVIDDIAGWIKKH
jgi:dienelactone hydrolase